MADMNDRDPQNTGQASYGNSGQGNQQPDRNQQADRQQQGQAGQQGERNPADPNNTHQTDTGIDSGRDSNTNEPGGVAGEDQR